MSDGFMKRMLTGIAEQLAADVPSFTWSPTVGYTAEQTGITIMKVPQSPDRIVALTPYPLGDAAALNDSDIGLQVRTRCAGEDPFDVTDLDDLVTDALIGRFPFTLPNGIRIVTLVRSSGAPMGQDANKRWEFTSNYRLGLYRPSAHRN